MNDDRGSPHAPTAREVSAELDGPMSYAGRAAPAPPTTDRTRSYYVCGVRVDDVTRQEALARIAALVEQPGFDRIATPNVDHIVLAQRDRTFRDAVNTSTLCLPDGRWLKRGSRLSGARFREAITGRKLVDPLCRMAARRAWRVYLLGSRGDVASRAAQVLRERHPGLEIADARSGSDDFGRDEAESKEILRELDRLRPDILFVACGAPRSEKWMLRHQDEIRAKVGIAVGYALDVIAGSLPECAEWITRAGFEWAHRLRHEPRRLWRRYLLRDPYFFYLILRSRADVCHGVLSNRHHDDAER